MNIAVILPIGKSDYLANTVLDGLIDFQSEDEKLSFIVTKKYPNPFNLLKYERDEKDFIDYAKTADIVILAWGKNSTNFSLAEKISAWQKTAFVDGSELGKNNRSDESIRKSVSEERYNGIGAIDSNMLTKCKLYFRREKPYIKGIIPLPFGIERRYRKFFKKGEKRDIDFSCIFGQDEYPPLRKQAKEFLEKFCRKNDFSCHTKKTKGFNFDDNTKLAGRDDFYKILSRTKVGISIGGGGFDTARFWEILGSGAMLLTENIAIYEENSDKLDYKRIAQFSNLDEFKLKIKELGNYIRDVYDNDQDKLDKEYDKVIENHSTKNRVKNIIEHFNEK